MTDQELKDLVANLAISQEKTDKQMKENAQQMKQTEALVKALSQNIDGVNRSIGQDSEEFFYSSLSKNPTIANINFDYIYRNDKRNYKGETQEIDILLENGESVGVVEVKNKVTQKSIDQLDTIMEKFEYFHPLYSGYRVIGAIAGKIFPEHLQKQALSKGYSVLTQQGDHIEQINPS
jgi:hypothetical protein